MVIYFVRIIDYKYKTYKFMGNNAYCKTNCMRITVKPTYDKVFGKH